MMGTKARTFALLPPVTLEDLVPTDHSYRHLERTLDLAFVRDLVRDAYADVGRPSIDPVVFFKLQLVMFFEGIRSERQLLRVVGDRLSLRWYLGYDLAGSLPDHSSLSRIRERYGLVALRRFFETIVEQCLAAGLVWGKELYIDATKVAANAGLDSLKPRFAVEAHLAHLFEAEEGDGTGDSSAGPEGGAGADGPGRLPVALTDAARVALAEHTATRHDWIGRACRSQCKTTQRRIYEAPTGACAACPLRRLCTTSKRGRRVGRSLEETYLERVRSCHVTEPNAKAMRKRQVWVEPLFA